ncbi:SOS response-associated peptidase family protein [Streptomyces echinatus]|uniref:Abasic site processing protein n=1 Tax=Streptomyces echinatus TaxID=67293 RepID=A0A7W9PSD0_9ACTN|nr:SOS response-associated peptidase family protein [Streptomyces echinatus]MBB5926377.1 hypothetical protein [Streptomyces echinatus]
MVPRRNGSGRGLEQVRTQLFTDALAQAHRYAERFGHLAVPHTDSSRGQGFVLGRWLANRRADPAGLTAQQTALLRPLRWGLVPSWAREEKIGARMIYARVETVHEKPAFRRAFLTRRCLLPADGFFEWQPGVRDLLAQSSVEDTLQCITSAATGLVEGCDAAGILILHGRQVKTLAPTDQLIIDSYQLQERLGEGPCFDAARSKQGERIFRIADFTQQEPRWPAYAPQAHDLGVGSMMGFLLYTEEEELGALNLYSRKPGAFTDDSETAGWLLASHATVAFSSARTHA